LQSGGVATLINPDAVYAGFLIHLFAVKPSTFTFSAKITLTDTAAYGAGIMYCLNSNTGVVGYTVQIGGQSLQIDKHLATTSQTLYNKYCPFVYEPTKANVIKISKSGTDFNVFCNGHFIVNFTDSEYPNGDIAVIVQKASTIKVDDVIVTDQFENAPASACFADSFHIASAAAWSNPSEGTATFGGGELKLDNTDSVYSSSIWADGISNMASIKAVVSHVSGAGIYGVAFGQTNGIIPFAFCVNAAKKYAIIYPDSLSFYLNDGPNILGGLGKDTIEVLRFANRFVFKVNGAIQDSLVPVPANFKVNLVGLYAGPKTCLASTLFIAGGDSTGAFCIPNSVANTPLPGITSYTRAFGNDCVVYDIMGRKIGRYDRTTFAGARLSKGLYFVVPSGAKAGSVMPLRLLNVRN
jgi:hypothetical protein